MTSPLPRGARFAPRLAAAFCALCSAATGVCRAELLEPMVSGYATISSDYRYRGLSEGRGEPSLQLGLDTQHRSGFFGGVWAARVEHAVIPTPATRTQTKVGYYAGLSRRVAADWSLTATITRYIYPGAYVDYDHTDISASAAFRDKLFFLLTHSDDLFASGTGAYSGEVGFAWPLPYALEVSAAVGKLDSPDLGIGYTHWNVGLSKTVASRVGLDLRYYDSSRYYSNAFATTAGDEWVLSASFGFGQR